MIPNLSEIEVSILSDALADAEDRYQEEPEEYKRELEALGTLIGKLGI